MMDVFNGVGKKIGNDILWFLGLLPHMQAYVLFDSDFFYDLLRNALPVYFNMFNSEDYTRNVCVIPRHTNPFAFHYTTNDRFNERYNLVFRVALSKLPAPAFVRWSNLGFLDYGHRIGELLL